MLPPGGIGGNPSRDPASLAVGQVKCPQNQSGCWLESGTDPCNLVVPPVSRPPPVIIHAKGSK